MDQLQWRQATIRGEYISNVPWDRGNTEDLLRQLRDEAQPDTPPADESEA